MAKAIVHLLPAGAAEVIQSASGLVGYSLWGFDVGDSVNYPPNDTHTTVSGNRVFSGGPNLMSVRILDQNTTRIAMMIPEGEGPFQVGNLMLFTSNPDLSDGPVPFAEVIFPFQVTKKLAQRASGYVGFPSTGDRLLVSINLNHRIVQSDDTTVGITINVQVISPDFASLAYFDTEANVPDASLIPWSQFMVNNLLNTGGPGLVSKRSDDTLWVYPFVKNIHHPKYHVFSGGVTGDQYRVDPHDYLWGGRFSDAPNIQRGPVGGFPLGAYTPQGSNFYGGLSFTTFKG